MDCKCGHYQYAHDFGKDACQVEGCTCEKFTPARNDNDEDEYDDYDYDEDD